MFADDTILYTTGETVHDSEVHRQQWLDSVIEWYDNNRLKLNSNKYIIIKKYRNGISFVPC